MLTLSPPLSTDPRWLRGHAAYTISKMGMSMITLGVAEDEREHGVGANCLWPRTLIATAAVQNLLGGDKAMAMSRTPEIVADAARVILERDPREATGNAYIDDEVLAAAGVTDLERYRAADGDLALDLFVEGWPAPDYHKRPCVSDPPSGYGLPSMTISPTEVPPRRGPEARPARGPRDRRRETLLFSRYGESRDPALREQLVERYLPLARTIARRYQSQRVPTEDLVQVAAIGLMKAIDRYDPARGIAFSSYAVPTMVGEVQRHFRDHTWGVRPPRDLQERAQRVLAINRTMSAELGRPPSAREIADRLRVSLEDVVEALQACDARDSTSLDRPRVMGEEGDTLADTLGGEDDEYDRVDHAITADLLMRHLDEREREILRLRFHEDLTQSEIGERIGCSQMHVSRLVRGAIAKLTAAAESDQVVNRAA